MPIGRAAADLGALRAVGLVGLDGRAEQVLNFLGLKIRVLSKWMTACLVAKGVASFGLVVVVTLIFTLAGFFLVPALVGDSLMLDALVGVDGPSRCS